MTILPLCAFPNVAYVKTLLTDDACIDLGENYVKQSLRNRFELVGPNGRFACSMHVVKQSAPKTPVTQIELNADDWRRHTLRSIESSYGNAAFFEHYFDEVKDLILSPERNLVQFNLKVLEWIESALSLQFKHTLSETYIDAAAGDVDLRSSMKIKDVIQNGESYPQVFEDKVGFEANLSVLDLLLNMGPESAMFVS